MKLRCLVVDDEPIAREGIAEYVRQIDFFDLHGTCANAIEASNIISSTKIDLVFLDIEMPRLNGIDFVQSLKNPPLIVFTTAYQKFALKGFELDVLDYLVKPISFEKFLKTANKALERYKTISNSQLNGEEKGAEYFFIKTDKKLLKIMHADVLYIEGLKDYVKIHTPEGSKLALINLKNIELKLPDHMFQRVHKSYIIALDKISFVEGNVIHLNKTEIPIGKEYKEKFFELLINKKLIGR